MSTKRSRQQTEVVYFAIAGLPERSTPVLVLRKGQVREQKHQRDRSKGIWQSK